MGLDNLLLMVEKKFKELQLSINFETLRKQNKELLAYLEQSEPSALKSAIGELYQHLCERLEIATTEYINAEYYNSIQIVYRDMNKVLELLTQKGIHGKIDFEVLQLMKGISFDDTIEDARILEAVSNNSLKLSPKVYLQCTSKISEDHRFAGLVYEDGEYYLITFREDGSFVRKEKAAGTAIYENEHYTSYHIRTRRNTYYVPINEMFPKRNMLPLHKYEDTAGDEYIVIGECKIYNVILGTNSTSHYICAKDGQIFSMDSRNIYTMPMSQEETAQEEIELNSRHPEYTDYDCIMQIIGEQMEQNLENYRNATRN